MNDKISLVLNDIVECKACDLCNIPVTPEIKYPIELMVVAEKPSEEESKLQSAWFDRHSRYVSKLIGKVFDNNNVYYTYILKCHVNKNLAKKDTKTCTQLFYNKEIDSLKPPRVLFMGNYFLKMFKFLEVAFGNIFQGGHDDKANDDCYMGWWNSPQFVLNAGTGHINNFNKLLVSLKQKEANYVRFWMDKKIN